MRKRGILLSLLCIIVIVAGIAGSSCAPKEEEVYELTLGNVHPPEDPVNVVWESWIRWIEEESDGRIKITLLPADQAGVGFTGYYDAVKTGIVDMSDAPVGFEPGRFPLYEATQLPFASPSGLINRATSLACLAVYDKYPEFQAQFEDVKFITVHGSGAGQLATVPRPVHTMEDASGLMISAVYGRYDGMALEALGATPETMDIMELYDALAKKTVDGLTISWTAAISFGFLDVFDYITEANICQGLFFVPMNLDTWNSLPSELQELFVGENALRLSGAFNYVQDSGEVEHQEIIESEFTARGLPPIYRLPDDERAKWVAAVSPIWETWVADASATFGEATVRAVLEDYLAFCQQYAWENYTPEEQQKDIDTLHEYGVPGY